MQNNFILNLLSRLPLKRLYQLRPLIVWILSKILKYRYQVIKQNLQNAFPSKSAADIEQLIHDYYHHLATITLEALKSKHMDIAEMSQRFHLTNPELVEQMCRQYGGALLLTPHFGNWEWGVSLGDQMQTPCTSFYKKLHNPKANGALLNDRNRFKMDLKPVNEAAKVLLKNKNSENSYVILFDQHPVGSKQIEWITFLNQPTAVNTTPAQLAAKLNYPIIYLNETFHGEGHYQMTAELIAEQPSKEQALSLTKSIYNKLEQQIKQHPSQWLWSHKRWKSKPPHSDEANQ